MKALEGQGEHGHVGLTYPHGNVESEDVSKDTLVCFLSYS